MNDRQRSPAGTEDRARPTSAAASRLSRTTAQREARGADVLPAVSRVDGGAPLAGERGEHGQRAVACRGDRQVDILECPLERELGRKVTAGHLVQLGIGDRRVKRAAFYGLRQLCAADAQLAGKFEGFGNARAT